MEKFAIDLDKVLDDFEFNEDCAEQISSINTSESNASSSLVAKCYPQTSSSKAYNYLVIEPGKTNKEFDITSCADKQNDSQQVNIDIRHTNESDAGTDNFNYSKQEATTESTDSINHFYTHECATNSKLTQKPTVPHNAEQVPLTIYNDISQKLLQKQQNDSSSPTSDNRYDKKLNQSNIKPSVSNVFNSLKEYINAPPGSLDYIQSVLDEQEIGPNIESGITQENEVSVKDTIVSHSQSTKNISEDTDVCIQHEETEIIANSAQKVSITDCYKTTIPVALGSSVIQTNSIMEDITKSIASTSLENIEKEQQQLPENVTVISTLDDTNCKYENAPIDTLSSQGFSNSSTNPKVENENAYSNHSLGYASENVDSGEFEEASQPKNNHSAYDCTYIQNPQDSVVDVTRPDTVIRKTINTEISLTENELNAEGENSRSTDEYTSKVSTVHKPFGFDSINDLSEEELTKYLTELEEEEQLNEKSNETHEESLMSNSPKILPGNTLQGIPKEDGSIYAVPIFEDATIAEVPKVSQDELTIQSKKFPVIDCNQEMKDGEILADLLGKQKLQEYSNSDELNSISTEQEYKSKEETSSNSVEVSNVTSSSTQSREHETLDKTDDSSSEHTDILTTSKRKRVTDAKGNEGMQEHCVHNLNDGQDTLDSVTIEKNQSQENEESVSHTVQCNRNCELTGEADFDSEENETSETKELDDNAIYSGNATPKPTQASTRHSVNDSSDESEKPVRPQTLDIVLTNNTDEHQMPGTASDTTPSGQAPSDTDGTRDDCQGSSPDLLDNCYTESNSILGKQPPFWVPDSDAPSCMLCEVKFTVIKRRHHCRACGKVLCNKCCNMKYKLQYQGNIDSRVCVPCYQLLTKAETEIIGEWTSNYYPIHLMNNDINSPQGRQPNPNNPMEYCSTIPPLQQLAGGLPPPPTVMVPVGVLKREGGTKNRPEGSKSVMFSDGIRPGCDLTELDMSWDLRPPYRRSSNKRLPTPGSSLPSSTSKRQNLPSFDSNTESYVPQDPNALPPTVTIHKGQVSYHTVTDEERLCKTLKNECEPPVMFAINRNLYVYVKITTLNCCVNKICWNVTSKGLACVGQDEVVLLIETLPDEIRIPKDLFICINQLYLEAIKGNTMSELGFSVYHRGNLLGSREHAGFLFIRQTLQCLQKIVLPPAPFLVGLLVHRWETPWAKVFPLRLLLRFGAEYRYYPCPLVSVRFRDAMYFEIGHTVMKVLADFRNFGYTLPGVRGLIIHLRNRRTDVMLPKNRYDQVIKGLNNSNDHVLAYASNFSISADSHLVCIQTNTGDESSYQTQAINIHNKPRTVTGASFIVINGALKSSMGLSAKSSIVEDGLMVEIMPEKMEALKAALKNMQDFSIGCGRQGAAEPDETVYISWVDNDVQFNLGVKSPIDDQIMDGIPSIRVHNGSDYKGTSRFIRWTEVFIIKSDDHPIGVHDPVDINKLSGNIARATCTALVKLLDLLATAGLTKLAVRTTIHPDNVGYEAGSEGTKLPPIYMNSLDNELIQVLHKSAQNSQDTHTVLELIFYVLDN